MLGAGHGVLSLAQPVHLAQHQAGFDRPVPLVDLEPHRRVDRLVLFHRDRGASEGDGQRPVDAAVQVETRVLSVSHATDVADLGRRDQQADARVARPERADPLELLGEVEPDPIPSDHGVDALGADPLAGPDGRRGVGKEGLAKGLHAARPDLQPGGGTVPAETLQVPGAGPQPLQEVVSGNAAPRAAAAPLGIERDHDRRLQVALDQARGDYPDHAGMPAAPGEDDRAGLAQLVGQLGKRGARRSLDLPLRLPALAVGAVELLRDLAGAPAIAGEEELDPRVSSVEAPGGVDPRCQAEAQVPRVEARGLTAGDLDQGPHPGAPGAPCQLEPAPGQRAVLAQQRDKVGDRGKGDEIEIELGCGRIAAGRLPQAPGQLPGDRRPAELGERVSAQRRVEDRAVGELGTRLVMVGDDHLHPPLPRPGDRVDRGDRAVHGEDQRGAALGERIDTCLGEPIAVGHPVGDQPVAIGPQLAEGADGDRRGADPVDVEVAVDGDPLAPLDRAEEPGRSPPPYASKAPAGWDSSASRKARACSGVR